MKIFFLVAGLSLLSFTALGETYDCQVVKRTNELGKGEVIWKDKISLKGSIDAKVIILDKKPIELEEIVKTNPTPESYKKAIAKYDGQLLIALGSSDGIIKLSMGHVDSTKKNMGPFEALAWADPGVKKIGVKNFQKSLEIECEK